MKAKELMIGDWVHVEAHRGFNAQNVKVETIPDNDGDNKYGHHYGHIGTWLDGGDNDFRDVEAKHLQPIPLTPEILEKNGFEVTRNMSSSRNKDVWSLRVSKNKVFHIIEHHNKREFPYFWIELGSNSDIKYVHELQHALRLCGITREIIL